MLILTLGLTSIFVLIISTYKITSGYSGGYLYLLTSIIFALFTYLIHSLTIDFEQNSVNNIQIGLFIVGVAFIIFGIFINFNFWYMGLSFLIIDSIYNRFTRSV